MSQNIREINFFGPKSLVGFYGDTPLNANEMITDFKLWNFSLTGPFLAELHARALRARMGEAP